MDKEEIPSAVIDPEPQSEEVKDNVLHAGVEECVDGSKSDEIWVEDEVLR